MAGRSLDPEIAAAHAGIVAYYSDKVARYGATALGVDWSCVPTQELRFVQLLKVCDFSGPVALDDIGCGYGALLGFLARRHQHREIDYVGVDLAPAMIRRARRLWRAVPRARFLVGRHSGRIADYAVASGIFNVKLMQPSEVWERFVAATLAEMHKAGRRGFAVNFRTPEARGGATAPGLYGSDPDRWITHCRRIFGASVELIDGYGLREYTLLVTP
jgi:SAM-dependent methyltransferase